MIAFFVPADCPMMSCECFEELQPTDLLGYAGFHSFGKMLSRFSKCQLRLHLHMS